MGNRRESRELALQFLYQQDIQSRYPLSQPEAFKAFWGMKEKSDLDGKTFAEALANGVIQNLEAVDSRIKQYAQNWDFHRIAVVDRNILRLAIYEMLFCADIPPIVSINEGIELAKKYSTEHSGRFVNGILDRVKMDLARPSRTPVEPAVSGKK